MTINKGLIVVPIINATTNLVALYPCYCFFKQGYYFGSCLTGCAMVASVFMHLSERKHNLVGLNIFTPRISNLLLYVDIFTSILLMSYGCYVSWKNDTIYEVLSYGIPFWTTLLLGELTNNLILYTGLHTIWHIGAFYTLSLII